MKFDELNKWDKRFIDLAAMVGSWSKGPRKCVGAVLVRPDRSIASVGYNGPPRGFDDELFLSMSREEQHDCVVHAEDNCLEQLSQSDMVRPKAGWTLYVTPLYPCADCANWIVDHKIKRVVAFCGHVSPDWQASMDLSKIIFKEAGVEYICVV